MYGPGGGLSNFTIHFVTCICTILSHDICIIKKSRNLAKFIFKNFQLKQSKINYNKGKVGVLNVDHWLSKKGVQSVG